MSVSLKNSIASKGVNFASNMPDKIEQKSEKKSWSNTVKVAVTASALTALTSIAIGVMAVKKGNAKAMAQGIKEGLEKGQKLGIKEGIEKGIKEGSEAGFKKGFDQAKKEMDKVVKAVRSENYNEGVKDGLKVASGKLNVAFDNVDISLADFKSYGGAFSRGRIKATINGQPFSGTLVTPKTKITYNNGRLKKSLLNDGTVKEYIGLQYVSVTKGNKFIDWTKEKGKLVKEVSYKGSSLGSFTTFVDGIPVERTLESKGMRFVKDLKTGETNVLNPGMSSSTRIVDGKKLKFLLTIMG